MINWQNKLLDQEVVIVQLDDWVITRRGQWAYINHLCKQNLSGHYLRPSVYSCEECDEDIPESIQITYNLMFVL